MDQSRRRILKQTPMFTIGRKSKQYKPRPGTIPKRFHIQSRPTTPQRTSIFMCLKNIPIQVFFAFARPSRNLTTRVKQIEEFEQTITLYDHLKYVYKGLPIKRIQYESECARYWLRLEQVCIAAFRKLAARWIMKRYHNRYLNTEDPGTCEVPIKPILLFDVRTKGSYVFEAVTLKKCVESALSYAEWMFPYPTKPSNPLTNIPFTDAQLLKILMDLRTYGFGSWMFESYKRLSFNLILFRDIFMVPIKLRSLQELLRDPNHEDIIDLLTEFIEDEIDYHEIHTRSYKTLLSWAVQHAPTHSYVEKWRKLYRRYTMNMIIYGTNEAKLSVLHDNIHEESLQILKQNAELKSILQLRTNYIQQAQHLRTITFYPSVTFVVS